MELEVDRREKVLRTLVAFGGLSWICGVPTFVGCRYGQLGVGIFYFSLFI